MDLKKLRIFATIAQTQSISRAAELTDYSQSGVSHMVKALEEELEKNQRFKRLAFEKYSEKVIDQKTYLEYTEIYSKKCEDIEAALQKRREEMEAVITAGASRNEWIRLFKKNRKIESLNRPLLLSLIERIEVSANKEISVRFAYQDQFEIAKEYISNLKMKEEFEQHEPESTEGAQSLTKHVQFRQP